MPIRLPFHTTYFKVIQFVKVLFTDREYFI